VIQRLGILGGTFDPVHTGHLEAAAIAQRALGLAWVRFVPSRTPPHRQATPLASVFHRFAMVALAVADQARFLASDEELRESGPSYTWHMLSRLHAHGFAPDELFFVLGTDAFDDIRSWYRYPDILDATNFVVVTRPGAPASDTRALTPSLASRMVDAAAFGDGTNGDTRIVLVAGTTPDVSSTEIRRRLASGESLEGLVPPRVIEHIHRHELYR
jgi:nicotinate-nucleotide adenylyltransferase